MRVLQRRRRRRRRRVEGVVGMAGADAPAMQAVTRRGVCGRGRGPLDF
jgi:hypothetical protein